MTKRWSMTALALALTGCVDLELTLREAPTRCGPMPTFEATPVTADQVTPTNARRMADALWQEMDREESGRLTADFPSRPAKAP
ncbi:MAG: hypothetical protein NZO58_10260 [Gemmataceae bacterium]|nr:hypothetical protein [Gemmataceae bacterium]